MLDGIRVIELATYVAVPGACALLADWGAEVIKVEAPGGDPFRHFFSAVGREEVAENRVFENDNRGKRSIVLDIRTEQDAATLSALVRTADVFVTNLRPASLDRLGVSWEGLRAAKPDLIFAQFTGYGSQGEDADKPGFDITAFWARSGLCALTSVKGGEPAQLRTGIGDHMAATALAAGIMAALYHRERTGEGQRIEGSLLRSGVYAASAEHAIQLQMGKLASTRPRPDAVNPLNNSFRSADGQWFFVVPRTGLDDWPPIARAAGAEALATDPRFASIRSRREHGPALVALLDEAFGARPWQEIRAALDAERLVFGPVQSVAQTIADPQAAAAGCYQQLNGTKVTIPSGPIDFGVPLAAPRPAPALDADGAALRAELQPR